MSCHKKCLFKLFDVDSSDVAEAQDITPATADQQQQTEPALQQASERPTDDERTDDRRTNNGRVMVVFLIPRRVLMFITYSDLVARMRAAKYVQRPYPVVNCTNRNYLFFGEESYLITKFEMDDGDEYYVLTTCHLSASGDRLLNENQYDGQIMFLYSPSPTSEIKRLLTILWS